jgi:phenylacetate-CoA ligase
MSKAGLFDPVIETAKVRDVERIQLGGLRRTLSVAKRSRLYQNACLDLDIGSLEDVGRLPFTTKVELREAYPYGALAVPLEKAVIFCSTSGTTGKPTAIYLTKNDLAELGRAQAGSMYGAGIRERDRAQLAIHPAMGLLFENALHEIGAMSVLTGPGNERGQLSLVRDLGITTLFGVPSYLLHLGSLLGEEKVGLERIVTLGESLVPASRSRIEDLWGVEVFDDYGSVELSAGFFECEEHDGHHLLWDHFLVETVDPATGEPAQGRGEMVFTTLKREATPLIRYRTGDLVRIEYDQCACGRTSPRIFPEGRLGEMTKVKGTAVYPSTLTEAVMAVREVENFRFVVDKKGDLDALTLQIEAVEPTDDLAERLVQVVKAASYITPEVSFVERGSLSGERKTKHFVDKRG